MAVTPCHWPAFELHYRLLKSTKQVLKEKKSFECQAHTSRPKQQTKKFYEGHFPLCLSISWRRDSGRRAREHDVGEHSGEARGNQMLPGGGGCLGKRASCSGSHNAPAWDAGRRGMGPGQRGPESSPSRFLGLKGAEGGIRNFPKKDVEMTERALL